MSISLPPVHDGSSTRLLGSLLIAPHQFLGLEREERLAEEFGIPLIVAKDREEFAAGIPDAAVVMVTPYARVESKDFEAMEHCRAVIRYGMGFDNIDVEAARQFNVPVSIVPGTASEEVASHALAMGLALARRIPQGRASIDRLGWAGVIGYDVPKLSDLRVGVIGLGRIGRQVAEWFIALGAEVKAYDPYATLDNARQATLEEVLLDSNMVSLHVPLNAETHHLISRETLARMRPGSMVVNVSRGGLIDEVALAEALESGHIAGAGLDTFSDEPLPADHPLRSAPNVILTPHIAWRSTRALDALQEGAVERARLALAGGTLTDVVS